MSLDMNETVTTPTVRTKPAKKRGNENYPHIEFANHLRALMLERHISQSDLARGVWGTMTDPRGYEVAKNRDR